MDFMGEVREAFKKLGVGGGCYQGGGNVIQGGGICGKSLSTKLIVKVQLVPVIRAKSSSI